MMDARCGGGWREAASSVSAQTGVVQTSVQRGNSGPLRPPPDFESSRPGDGCTRMAAATRRSGHQRCTDIRCVLLLRAVRSRSSVSPRGWPTSAPARPSQQSQLRTNPAGRRSRRPNQRQDRTWRSLLMCVRCVLRVCSRLTVSWTGRPTTATGPPSRCSLQLTAHSAAPPSTSIARRTSAPIRPPLQRSTATAFAIHSLAPVAVPRER